MAVCAAIVSTEGVLHFSSFMPYEFRDDIAKHAQDFLQALNIEDDEVELTYIETSNVRYIYKQTDDLYWLLVTRIESDMFADINLLGRFVCTIMEYGSSETNSITLTDEQRDLFYRHIWRPWDDGYRCISCGCTCQEQVHIELEGRLGFLTRIRDGHVDDEDVIYFNRLMTECWSVASSLTPKKISSSHNSSFTTNSSPRSSLDESIGEETLIDNVKLKCYLEDMRVALTRLQDPYLRLCARRDLLVGTNQEQNNIIGSAPTLKELDMECFAESE